MGVSKLERRNTVPHRGRRDAEVGIYVHGEKR